MYSFNFIIRALQIVAHQGMDVHAREINSLGVRLSTIIDAIFVWHLVKNYEDHY